MTYTDTLRMIKRADANLSQVLDNIGIGYRMQSAPAPVQQGTSGGGFLSSLLPMLLMGGMMSSWFGQDNKQSQPQQKQQRVPVQPAITPSTSNPAVKLQVQPQLNNIADVRQNEVVNKPIESKYGVRGANGAMVAPTNPTQKKLYRADLQEQMKAQKQRGQSWGGFWSGPWKYLMYQDPKGPGIM